MLRQSIQNGGFLYTATAKCGTAGLALSVLSGIVICISAEENTPSRYPSAAESIAALRARVAAANAAGNAATAAAVANNEIIAANEQGIRDINADVANAPKPDPDLTRVMFPDQHS